MLHHLARVLSAADAVRVIEQACGAGVFSIDLATYEVTISAGLGAMLGLAAEEHTYALSDIAKRLHPLDLISAREALDIVEHGGPSRREIRVVTPHGAMRWLRVQFEVLANASGLPTRLIGVANDAGLGQQGNHERIAGRDRLRHLVMGVAPIVWAAKPDGQLTEMTGWESVTGMRDSKALGTDWVEGVHMQDRDLMLGQWMTSIQRKTVCDSEVRILQSDGCYRWFRVHGVPQLHKSGGLREWSGIAIDVHAQVVGRRTVRRNMVTGAQIRASRGMLKWSVQDLCKATGLTPAVVRRLESTDGFSLKPAAALDAVAAALRRAGVEFIFEDGEVPGVRPF